MNLFIYRKASMSEMSRDKIARWIIEKLLASFVISAIIIYGPIVGFNIQTSGLGTTYTVVTSVTLFISLVAHILVPHDFGIRKRINGIIQPDKEKENS